MTGQFIAAKGTAPANPPSGYATLFIDTADNRMKVKQSDGTIDVVSIDSEFQDMFLDLQKQGSTPANPATGTDRLFFDNSNNLNALLHDGTVIPIGPDNPNFLELVKQGSLPADPPSGSVRLLFDTSNNLGVLLEDSEYFVAIYSADPDYLSSLDTRDIYLNSVYGVL